MRKTGRVFVTAFSWKLNSHILPPLGLSHSRLVSRGLCCFTDFLHPGFLAIAASLGSPLLPPFSSFLVAFGPQSLPIASPRDSELLMTP